MARKCGPPKTVRVKDYDRGSGAARRRRKAKAKAARKAKVAGTTYWTCVNNGTGRTCGSHHRKMTGAVAHRVKLDKAARAHRARYGGAANLWHIEKRTA